MSMIALLLMAVPARVVRRPMVGLAHAAPLLMAELAPGVHPPMVVLEPVDHPLI